MLAARRLPDASTAIEPRSREIWHTCRKGHDSDARSHGASGRRGRRRRDATCSPRRVASSAARRAATGSFRTRRSRAATPSSRSSTASSTSRTRAPTASRSTRRATGSCRDVATPSSRVTASSSIRTKSAWPSRLRAGDARNVQAPYTFGPAAGGAPGAIPFSGPSTPEPVVEELDPLKLIGGGDSPARTTGAQRGGPRTRVGVVRSLRAAGSRSAAAGAASGRVVHHPCRLQPARR